MSDELERLLEREFAAAMSPVADDGFTERLGRRLRRRARLRLLVLGAAVLAGCGIALGPVLHLAEGLAGLAVLLAGGWSGLELSGHYAYVAAAVLVGLVSPLAIHLLER